jgi:hypothetical protein
MIMVLDLKLHQENPLNDKRRRQMFQEHCTKDHKTVKTLTIQDNSSSCSEGTRSGCENKFFSNWFLQSIYDGEVDTQLVFFSDEAWFSLFREVNSQNNQYWSEKNPRFIHKLPLHDEKIGIWCAISAHRVIGPTFTNCYTYEGVVGRGLAGHLCSHCFAVMQEEIQAGVIFTALTLSIQFRGQE